MNVRHQQILDQFDSSAKSRCSILREKCRSPRLPFGETWNALRVRGRSPAPMAARCFPGPAVEFAFLDRTQERTAEKQAIARYLATVIQPGMTVVLDTGTTTLEVARAIAGIPRLRVLTSSLAIASALYAYDNIELVLLGGTVRHHSPDLSGPLTEENMRQFHTEVAILGADAVTPDGLYTSEAWGLPVSPAP